MKLEPTLSSHFIEYICDYLLDHNIDPDPILKELKLPAYKNSNTEHNVSLFKIVSFILSAKNETKDNHIGLHLAERYHYESAGLIILAMLAAPTVKEGIETLCNYDKYVDSAIIPMFEVARDVSELRICLVNPDGLPINELIEFLICFTVSLLNKATRKAMPINEVWFEHDYSYEATPLVSFFNSPVKFSQSCNKISFRNDCLDEPFYTSNRLLHETLVNTIKTHYYSTSGDSVTNSVIREIMSQMPVEMPSLKMIASNLAMSERTLKRHLNGEGHTFQEIKKLARIKQAKYYLINHPAISVSEVAYKLGYSEVSTFSRAFRSIVGIAPQDFRKEIQNKTIF